MGKKYIIDLTPDCVKGEYLRIPARIAGEQQWLMTNLINVGLCKECYEIYMDKPMRMLNEKCMLNINFGDEGGEGK